MGTKGMGACAGLVLGVLLGAGPARAQDAGGSLPPAGRSAGPAAAPAASVAAAAMPMDPAPPPMPAGDGPSYVENHCGHCPGEVFTDVGYLLMQPRRRAFDYAVVDPQSNGVPQGRVADLQWDTDSGVRVGAGYRLPGDGWEVGAWYTYFHAGTQQSADRPDGGTLFATLTHPGNIEQVDTAQADSGLTYQVLDVEIGRPFHVCESCTLRAFGGGRFAWIDQSLNAYYDGGDANHAYVHSPVDFRGAGLRVGGEGTWNMNWGFSLFARASGSLVVGDFKTRLTEANDGGATVNTDVSDDFEKMVPVTEIGIGVGWQYRTLWVRCSFEMSNWFGMVDSPDFADDVHQGKLTHRTSDPNLEGLAVQAGLSF